MRRKPTRLKQHPMAVGWNSFKEESPETFSGTATGFYLSNRLEKAFQAGWNANESLRLERLASGRGA
jgi:hypothetical protein